jgi:hypothetical protein
MYNQTPKDETSSQDQGNYRTETEHKNSTKTYKELQAETAQSAQ